MGGKFTGRPRGARKGSTRTPPFGFRRTGVGEEIERHPVEWPVVERIMQLRREQLEAVARAGVEASWQRLTERVNAEGHRPRRGAKWSEPSIANVVKRHEDKNQRAA